MEGDLPAESGPAGGEGGGGGQIRHQRKQLSESSMCSVVELASDSPALTLSISMKTAGTEQFAVLRSFRTCPLNFLKWSLQDNVAANMHFVNVAEFL